MKEFEVNSIKVLGTNYNIMRVTDILWALKDGSFRIARDGSIDIEPLPSNRSREYVEQHCFTLNEAKRLALQLKQDGTI